MIIASLISKVCKNKNTNNILLFEYIKKIMIELKPRFLEISYYNLILISTSLVLFARSIPSMKSHMNYLFNYSMLLLNHKIEIIKTNAIYLLKKLVDNGYQIDQQNTQNIIQILMDYILEGNAFAPHVFSLLDKLCSTNISFYEQLKPCFEFFFNYINMEMSLEDEENQSIDVQIKLVNYIFKLLNHIII